MAKKRCLMLGAGGFAHGWIRRYVANFGERVEIVGLVDIKEDILNTNGDFLGLPRDRRFTDMATAFASVDADYCTIVIPPAFHKEAVMQAVAHKLPILSEKPIADTWESCLDIYRAVKEAGLKMEVVQNYRYLVPMLTMRSVLRDDRLGKINYIFGRFAADYRKYGSWGIFRHEIPHALLVEGAVHHFDMLRNLAGAECQRISGWEWNPSWSSFKGESNALYLLEMANGVRAVYEGSCNATGEQNSWAREQYRAECERGTVGVGADNVVRIHNYTQGQGLKMEEVPPVRVAFDGHNWIVNEFLDWLDGGPTPDTALDENIKSVAMVFGAIEASRTNRVVDLQEMVSSVL